jgi:hypothetical protein
MFSEQAIAVLRKYYDQKVGRPEATGVPPLILQSQIYGVLMDRTEVDKELVSR